MDLAWGDPLEFAPRGRDRAGPRPKGARPAGCPGARWARRSSISVALPAWRGDKGHAPTLSASPFSFPFLAAGVTLLLPHSQAKEEGWTTSCTSPARG